ncbi:unnamed protein product, partial [Ectocarpus sp. 12 AP-2014]
MGISNYEIGKEIGSESFGTINLAEDLQDGEKVVVKCVSKNNIQRSHMGSQVKKEITTMKKLDHPTIVRIVEVLMSHSHLYLVLEFARGGELFTKLAKQGRMSESVARRYFQQVMNALNYCHDLYICHRDIKPEKIRLDVDDNVKIADFGFASKMEPEPEQEPGWGSALAPMPSIHENIQPETIQTLDEFISLAFKRMQKMSTMCGTTHYMAPEIVNRTSYRGDKADIGSCGVVLFVLLTGLFPFDSAGPNMVVQKIKNGTFVIPDFVSSVVKDVLGQLFTPNLSTRPSARTVVRHEGFAGSDAQTV